jgi:hypothetical protein
MKDIAWLIVVVLIIGWLVGFIGFGEAVGSMIHVLIVLAVVLVIFKLLRK